MALEGNLRDFSLEHIFQLIHTGKKTGTLHIVRGDGEAEAFVYFRSGKIFGAVSNFNRVPIGERLVGAGHIMSEDLNRALAIQKDDKKRRKLGQILVSEGLITPEILKQIVREQIQSTVFDLLPWEEGEFQFSPQLPPVEDIGLLVSAKKALSEGRQRLDEWDRVREQVPSLGAVFAINDMAPRHKDITLSQRHWKLLRFIDGNRSVTELALIARISEFETSSILYDLADAGLLRLIYEKENGKGKCAVPEDEADSVAQESQVQADNIDDLPEKETIAEPEPANAETRSEERQADNIIKEDVSNEDEESPPTATAVFSETESAIANLGDPASVANADFAPELDIDGLDSMVSNELLAYRGEFMSELTALTDNNWSSGRLRSKKSSNLDKLKKCSPVDSEILIEVIKQLK